MRERRLIGLRSVTIADKKNGSQEHHPQPPFLNFALLILHSRAARQTFPANGFATRISLPVIFPSPSTVYR